MARYSQVGNRSMCRMSWLLMATTIVALTGCNKHEPEPTCRETLKVTERNGQRVLQAVNGLYLREDFPVSDCESQSDSQNSHQRQFTSKGLTQLFWLNHRIINSHEYKELQKTGKLSSSGAPYAVIEIGIGFGTTGTIMGNKLPPAWWFKPAIPHHLYPIDLLPNFGLDMPDQNAGVGPIKSKPTAYWAIRGSKNPLTKQPYVTFCSISPPPNNPENDVAYQRDVKWLVQGKTYLKESIGNTCRGGVSADNEKPIGARIDVPGAGVADIDKIYQAVSKYLSDLTVD